MAKLPSDPNRTYRDFSFSFAHHPVTGDLAMLTGGTAVSRSIRNLVSTDFFERYFDPKFGSGVKQSLFEPANGVTSSMLKNKIEDVIENYEPRAELIEVNVELEVDEMYYKADIIFRITSELSPIEIEIFLKTNR